MAQEKVNHPNHYNRSGRKECIEEIKEKYGLKIAVIFCLTNAYKYLYRCGEKAGSSKEEDIAKARWYLGWAKRHEAIIQGQRFIHLFRDIIMEMKRYD